MPPVAKSIMIHLITKHNHCSYKRNIFCVLVYIAINKLCLMKVAISLLYLENDNTVDIHASCNHNHQLHLQWTINENKK